MKKYILLFIVLLPLFFTACKKDNFAKLNTDPSITESPNIRYLFTQGLADFKPSEYWAWYYDYANMLRWGQITVSGGGNSNLLNSPSQTSGGGNVGPVLKIQREIDFQIKQLGKKDGRVAASYQYIRTMTVPLVVYMGIQDMDMYGSMPYSEAYRARYTNPQILTPKYETQEELLNLFIKELDDAIKVLTNPVMFNNEKVSQVALGNQDFVYKGDAGKWAKFCNSLKLKIAVRLLHANRAKALDIAKEVAANPVGMIENNADNFVYNQGTEWYHSQENPDAGYGNKNLIDFMVANKDPRVRFFFAKNDFNSKVVQAFFDAKAEEVKMPDVPSYIADKIDFEIKDGKKVFKAWKAPGEPWVRYCGLPSEIGAGKNDAWNEYFSDNLREIKLKINGKEETKRYTPVSALQMEMYKGDREYTYPDAPGSGVNQDKVKYPFYGLYFSAGEVNLYLAELKLYGADLPKSAADYFNEGIKTSVTGWDEIAGKNHIPYYDNIFDPNEKSIKLEAGEVASLLNQPAYALTGDANLDLEKVYIQQRLNFIFMPLDMFVSMRRGGVPTKTSTLLRYDKFNADGGNYIIPRRFPFNALSPTDQMKNIVGTAMQQQGFTVGNNPSQLNTERVWYDKGAPNFGEGPKL